MTWHLEINDAAADEVGMNTGTPLTEAILPPAVDVGNDTVALVGNTFRQGDRDAGPNGDIRSAQTNMVRMGIEGVGEVDGVYGRNTMNGVQDSQEMFGLPRTGVLDQATQDAFNNLTDDQIAFFTSESEAMAPAVETPVTDETEEQGSDVTTSLRPQLRNDRKVTISRLGSSFGDASRDDVKVLQTTLRDMAGPSEVEVGSIDGQWGTKGRNALWAFQLRSGIDPTGEMNEETATALNGPSDSLDPRLSKINVDSLQEPSSKMLVGVEALKLMPYELNSNRLGRSGLTFGAGIDVGQHSAAYLKNNFNFTDEMIDEFGVYDAETNPEGWIGRNPASPSKGGQGGNLGTAARNRVHAEMAAEYRRQREAGELPVVAEKWILENIKPVYDEYVGKPKVKYDSLYGSGSWGELPEEAQAIAVLENYRGDGVNPAQLRLLREGDFFGAARAAKKSSRSPAMIKVLRELGHAE